ncbi:MAG: TetR/AcrR family transcriptional regulator [Candidatus Cloacimonadota bacterium]|nr:MAG: TetR/AcrR family transcriptional regulator [Candidatus Cloacimonadota bacterium]
MKMNKKKSEIILQMARKLFARYGLKKTSMDDIAAEAKIGKATIYYYFKSKQEIFKTVVDHEWTILINAIRDAISKEISPQRKLRAFILTRISRMHELVNLYRVTKDIVTELLPDLEKIRESHFKEEMNVIKRILSEGVRKGIFKVKKIEVTALAMISALKGLEYPWVMDGKSLDIERSVDELLQILFKGIEVK